MTALLLAHEAACALLFFTVFCRMQKTDGGTRTSVRLSFLVLGTVAALGMAWPAMSWGMGWYGVILALAIVQVQWVTSHYWRASVPGVFTNDA